MKSRKIFGVVFGSLAVLALSLPVWCRTPRNPPPRRHRLRQMSSIPKPLRRPMEKTKVKHHHKRVMKEKQKTTTTTKPVEERQTQTTTTTTP